MYSIKYFTDFNKILCEIYLPKSEAFKIFNHVDLKTLIFFA
jgi:hypothetical protein